jgi:hypothetical protein
LQSISCRTKVVCVKTLQDGKLFDRSEIAEAASAGRDQSSDVLHLNWSAALSRAGSPFL